MNWYKKAQYNAFHGTTCNIKAFNLDNIGKGNDQEGPGIYFTSSPEDASSYSLDIGGRVYPVCLNFNKVVPLEGQINENEIKLLILHSLGIDAIDDLYNLDTDIFWDNPLSNWGENPISAFNDAVDSIINYSSSPHDAFMQVWYDFYKNNSKDYLLEMQQLGYDGVIIPKQDGIYHYIVFNPEIISSFYSKK